MATDVFLYAGEANPNDVRLQDPTTSPAATFDLVITASTQAATGAATAELVFDIAVTASTKAATGVLAAQEVFDLAVAASTKAATAVVAAEQVFNAAIAASAKSATAAATAELVFDAAVSAMAQSATGLEAAEEVFDIVVAATTAGATAAIVAEVEQAEQVDQPRRSHGSRMASQWRSGTEHDADQVEVLAKISGTMRSATGRATAVVINNAEVTVRARTRSAQGRVAMDVDDLGDAVLAAIYEVFG